MGSFSVVESDSDIFVAYSQLKSFNVSPSCCACALCIIVHAIVHCTAFDIDSESPMPDLFTIRCSFFSVFCIVYTMVSSISQRIAGIVSS